MDVISIGDINVDLITSRISHMPKRDSQIAIDNISMDGGGCAANFAAETSLLGLKTRFIGKIGEDIFANFLMQNFGDVDARVSKGTKTGVTIAITFKDGSRSFITYPGSNGELTIKDIDLNLIEGKYLHLTSLFLHGLGGDSIKILDYAHSKGMTTSLDTGGCPTGWDINTRKIVKKVLRGIDIFFPNLDEARGITQIDHEEDEEEICDALLNLGPEFIGLKMGSEGSYIATHQRKIFVPAFRVKVVDSTGAGDVWDAAFISGHFKGWDIEKTGRFANAAGALSATGVGRDNYPTEEDINRLLTGESK